MSKKFDLEYLFVEMSSCYEKSDHLDMDSYLRAYAEFNKFFGLMGTVFGFVSSDVSSKLDILGRLRCGQDGKCFETVGQMIVHEEESKLLHDPKYVSGSRTLLRLHRALIFIAIFLDTVHKADWECKLANLCQDAYRETLGQYHPWIIQKAAIMAMYALPTKQGLLNRIKADEETAEIYNELLPKAVAAMKEVYRRTEQLYKDHDLLDLP